MNFLIHTINRRLLTEGRSSGITLGLAEKFKINNGVSYILKTGLSACKDYLNDVIAVERSGFKPGLVYGFNYLKNSFKIKEKNYLIIRQESYVTIIKEEDLKSNRFLNDGNYKKVTELNCFSENNLKNSLYILNRIEKEIFKFTDQELTTIERIEDYITNDDLILKNPLFVYCFSKKWLNNQINISLFSNLIRRSVCVENISEEEKNLDIFEFIDLLSKKPNLSEGFELNYFKNFKIEDILLVFNSNLKKLNSLIGSKKIGMSVHNYGVSSFMSDLKNVGVDECLIKLGLKKDIGEKVIEEAVDIGII